MTHKLAGLLLILTLAVPAPSSATLTMFWGCEDTTSFDGDPDYSQGDTSVATGAGTPTNDASAVKVGTNGCLINAAGEYFVLDNTVATALLSPTDGAIAFWIQWPSAFPATASFFHVRGSNSNDYVQLFRTGTDELRMQVKSQTGPTTVNIDSTDANIATGTWYFIIMKWDATGDVGSLSVYDSSGVAIGSSPWTNSVTTDPVGFASTTGIRMGETGGISATYYMDNIMFGTYSEAATMLCNRNITTYTSYAACGGGGGGATVNFFPRRLQVNP